MAEHPRRVQERLWDRLAERSGEWRPEERVAGTPVDVVGDGDRPVGVTQVFTAFYDLVSDGHSAKRANAEFAGHAAAERLDRAAYRVVDLPEWWRQTVDATATRLSSSDGRDPHPCREQRQNTQRMPFDARRLSVCTPCPDRDAESGVRRFFSRWHPAPYMVSSDDERAAAVAVERLQDLGLSQYEAQTLVSLVRLETGTAQEVAEVGDVPRTRVYEAAERLHELGLVDIQHGTPRAFTVVSRESIVRTLDVRRENTITDLAESLTRVGSVEHRREQLGVWTVTGRKAVAARIDEFVADADERVVYMTVDDLLTETHLDRLAAAADDGVSVYIAGISERVQDRIEKQVPSVTLFDTLWAWEDTPAGSLLVVDEQTALVSALTGGASGRQDIEETAVWGSGERNSLVVVLRAIFTWRLNAKDLS